MSIKTLSLIIFLAVVTILLLVLAFLPWGKTTPSKTQESQTPSPTSAVKAETTLSFSPQTLTVDNTATQTSAMITIDSGTNMITAVQLELSFDPKAVSNVDVTTPPSDGFFPIATTLFKTIDQDKGTISFATAPPLTAKAVQGSGTIAIVTFTPIIKSGQTTISFTPKTLVTAEGTEVSVVKRSTNLTITAQ